MNGLNSAVWHILIQKYRLRTHYNSVNYCEVFFFHLIENWYELLFKLYK